MIFERRRVPGALPPLTGGQVVQKVAQSAEPEDLGVLHLRTRLRLQPFGLGKVLGQHDLAPVLGLAHRLSSPKVLVLRGQRFDDSPHLVEVLPGCVPLGTSSAPDIVEHTVRVG
eukprot:9228913-Heterocapsa_arctica.AAC.1